MPRFVDMHLVGFTETVRQSENSRVDGFFRGSRIRTTLISTLSLPAYGHYHGDDGANSDKDNDDDDDDDNGSDSDDDSHRDDIHTDNDDDDEKWCQKKKA